MIRLSLSLHFSTPSLAFLLALFLIGCATPDPPRRSQAEETLTPWTPTRIGQHPGERLSPLASPAADRPSRTGASEHHHLASGTFPATVFLAWRLYSHTLSRTSGDTCRFSPTCSRFAVDAAPLGPEGLILTFARLLRSQLDDPLYQIDDQGFLIDPPSHYFFWRAPLGLDAHQYDLHRSHRWYLFLHATKDLSREALHD